MPLDLKKLNNEQKEAVLHKNGPLLIVAGAGTGKTTVITQRIVNLIESGLAKPEEILAVTFTEKAASEMEERVDNLLDYGYVDLWISTFHSFCERVLRDNALDIGLPTDFKILDGTSAWLLMRQNLDEFELKYYKTLGNPTKFIQALIYHFSRCKDQEVYPDDYLNYAETLKTSDDAPESEEIERIKEVATAYHVYQRLLLQNSSLDFGDLINYCLKLFKERPLILKKYREKFKYILVDEFQDTNWSQYELIKLLSEPNNNLTVCADDDQAIYRWRGASFSNIVQFTKDFSRHSGTPQSGAKQISLIKNYRSPQNILDLSYKFIKANDPDRLEFVSKINKKLISEIKGEGVIKHIHEKTLDKEVGETIKKILEILKRDKDATYNDFAILIRANDPAIPFIRALEKAGLPYQFLASRGLYTKPIILDVISYFKLLDNYHEGASVYRILSLKFLEIPDDDLAKITQYSHKKTKSLFETLQELPLIQGVSATAQEKCAFILSLIKKHTNIAKEKGVCEIMTAFLEDSGYLKYLTRAEDQEKIDLLNQFYKRAKKFEETNVSSSLRSFIEEINLELESGDEGKLEFDIEKGPNMIKVMTIHGAKGLEFKYVFLVNMVDKRFPTIERKDPIELPADLIKDIKPKGDVHLQEERRICYVAMTRAKKDLYFTSAEDYGLQRKKKLSRFLAELGFKEQSTNQDMPISQGVKETFMNKEHKANENILRSRVSSNFLPEHFSYSQLAAFEKCPLQYKFNFILKIPVKGKAVFSFGKTIHNTLYEFLKLANEEKKSKQKDLFNFNSSAKKEGNNFEGLVKIYEKNWIDEWYESKKQKEEYHKLGKKIIKNFYEEFSKNPPNVLRVNNSLALEIPFNLKVGEYTLFGVIDRMDKTDDGIVIIDYKTGQSKDKLDFENKEQLLIYQIAAQEIFKIKPIKLTYYYLEDGKKTSFLGSEKEIEIQKQKIIKLAEQINSSNFKATPGWQCSFCDFKDICDFAQRN